MGYLVPPVPTLKQNVSVCAYCGRPKEESFDSCEGCGSFEIRKPVFVKRPPPKRPEPLVGMGWR